MPKLFLLLIVSLVGLGGLIACGPETDSAETVASVMQWQAWDSVQAGFPAAAKPLFLFVKENGCDHCEVMEAEVFSRPDIARYMNANFTSVAIDIYLDTPLRVRDSLLSESRFRQLLSIKGIPAYYFFDTTGRVIGVLEGEIDLLSYKRMLVFINEGHFFKTPYEQFLKLPQASEEAINQVF